MKKYNLDGIVNWKSGWFSFQMRKLMKKYNLEIFLDRKSGGLIDIRILSRKLGYKFKCILVR